MQHFDPLAFNQFLARSYRMTSFAELLTHVILHLHEHIMYESGMFFCGISHDCSFFRPHIDRTESMPTGSYFQKKHFPIMEEYLKANEEVNQEFESRRNQKENPFVFKASDYKKGLVQIEGDPRGDFLSSQKGYHIVCIRIVHDGQFLGEIYLHRSVDQPDFDSEDMIILGMIEPHISNIFGMIHQLTAIRYMEVGSAFPIQKGICIFDETLNLTGGNVTGLDILKWITAYRSSVLYHIRDYCSTLLSDTESPSVGAGAVYFHSLKLPDGVLEIEIHDFRRHKNAERSFCLLLEKDPPIQCQPEYKLKFTKREADVIDGLLQGKTIPYLSNHLNISENTVKSHVKNIYQKTGAKNRTELTFMMMKL